MFQLHTEEEIKQTQMQCKQAALRALQQYNLNWEQIRFNQLSDTCTFVLKMEGNKKFLLRIHSGKGAQELESELILLESLDNKIDSIIPQGFLSRNGFRVIEMDLEEDPRYHATLMSWVEGEHVKGEMTNEQAFREGILLAKLHQASQALQLTENETFKRPTWGNQAFKQSMTRLAGHYNTFLSDTEFKLYRSAAEQISSWLTTLHQDKDNYGLIHGDLHQGNIIFHHEEPRAIDFGRCGYGYFLYDISHTILGLYPAQREQVIKGYESMRKLEEDWFRKLEGFTVMVMIENFCHHAPDPRETESLKAEQSYAQAIIRHYLDGRPFLFNAIDVE